MPSRRAAAVRLPYDIRQLLPLKFRPLWGPRSVGYRRMFVGSRVPVVNASVAPLAASG